MRLQFRSSQRFRECPIMSDYTTDEARWAALNTRDSAADGVFFYAVVTTGVFCRPSCASRPPLRANVCYFDGPEAARAAGFRPCKRCQPEGLPREQAIVARARAVLDARGGERISLTQLSEAVHLSPFHLQRLFKRVTGVSPRAYQAAARAAALREQLHGGAPVTRAAADAGYGSASQLYADAKRELGMTPAAYRRRGAGLKIAYATAATALGQVLVAATDKGVCRIAFGDSAAALVDELREAFAQAALHEDGGRMVPFIAEIEAYLSGAHAEVALPLDLHATAFQLRVWDALRHIPNGETRSYTELAHALAMPRAVRAVASACAANPVALAIPCHRVLQKGGALAGYRWGLPRKAALLAAEAKRAVAGVSAERDVADANHPAGAAAGRDGARQDGRPAASASTLAGFPI
jgi:AraC family transcriptional regulator, regulatory protein of adaptative response / methylated-DNA-[protein]-cysteine methyltransferase